MFTKKVNNFKKTKTNPVVVLIKYMLQFNLNAYTYHRKCITIVMDFGINCLYPTLNVEGLLEKNLNNYMFKQLRTQDLI